jgi:hypothetical protein
LLNGTDENTPDLINSIPENMLFSGRVYDDFDKGTDIKIVNYSRRRMSPIEDFAVSIPTGLQIFTAQNLPSYGKYVKRWTHDPNLTDDPANQQLSALQREFGPDSSGQYYHPIGYPVYLEALADYSAPLQNNNNDPRLLNETVFFVINETTSDFIRVNFKQVNETNKLTTFRTRVELVPDSTNRNPDNTFRRSREGLLNFGIGRTLLDNLRHNAYNEDAATLPGRKWTAPNNLLGGEPRLFHNRPTMPVNNAGTATFYGGEKYHALPVNVGDVVRIISRTQLWKTGSQFAYDQGISFVVKNSTDPPVFTGDVVNLQKVVAIDTVASQYPWQQYDTIYNTPFLNTVFVTEDRYYPALNGQYSDPNSPIYDPNLTPAQRGRDSIMSITAKDYNNFYDPRSYFYPDLYTRLTYRWLVDSTSGLAQWLQADTIFASQGTKDSAQGYIVLKGHPTNPYVVPGGESVSVYVDNYPPHYRLIDSLKAMQPPLPENIIDQFLNVFPPYFNASVYDTTEARFLQQDTIDNGINYTSSYKFKLFVVDSNPRFILPPEQASGIYQPTVFFCGRTKAGQVIANLTDKLRMQVDFNTDDEAEDTVAHNKKPNGWD